MALNTTQLNDVKTKMEAGTNFRTIVKDDYPSEKVPAVRKQMVEEFGQDVLRDLMLSSRLGGKTVEELNTVIAGIQGRLATITAIRDAKL